MLKITPITFRCVHLSKVVTSRGTFIFNPPVEFAASNDTTDTVAALSLLRQVFHLAYKEAQRKQRIFNSPVFVYSDANYSRIRDWFENVLLGQLRPGFAKPATAVNDEQTEYIIQALQSRYSDIVNVLADIFVTHAVLFTAWNKEAAKSTESEVDSEENGRNKTILSLKLKTFFGENYSFEMIATAPESEKDLHKFFSHCVSVATSKIFQRFYSAWCSAAMGCEYDDKIRITYFHQTQHVVILARYLDSIFSGVKSPMGEGVFSLGMTPLEIPRHISNSEMTQMENNLRISFEYKNKKTAIQMISDFMKHKGTLHPNGIAH